MAFPPDASPSRVQRPCSRVCREVHITACTMNHVRVSDVACLAMALFILLAAGVQRSACSKTRPGVRVAV